MLKRLIVTTAATALVVGVAVAQQQPPAQKSPPPATKSEPMPPAAESKAESKQGARNFVTSQSTDQWLWSQFRGMDVIGSNNEKIGDVSDILFDQNGRVMAYVVGVGGFLGIGAKDVALAPASFQMQAATEKEEAKLKLSMTREELKNAPEFKAKSTQRPAPTTGQAPPRDKAPATPPAPPR